MRCETVFSLDKNKIISFLSMAVCVSIKGHGCKQGLWFLLADW